MIAVNAKNVMSEDLINRKRRRMVRSMWILLIGLVAYLLAQTCLTDGIRGVIVPTTTVFATGYSDSAWRSVQKGMTTGTVRRLLGVPLILQHTVRPGHPDETRWEYSGKPGRGTPCYRQRVIVFSDGKVVDRMTGVIGGQ